jgi:glycosyltransferase involved in cell wall biosynthesis
MRLWIDGQCLQTTSRLRGIGRYALELIRAIAQNHPEVEMSISFNAAMAGEAVAARELAGRWIEPRNMHVWQGAAARVESRAGFGSMHRLSEAALAHHVACLAPDVALSASPFEGQDDFAAPLLTRAGHDFPWAAIFYDAIPQRYPERYLTRPGLAAAYRRRLEAVRGFDLLLAISDFARREALDLVPGARAVRIDAGVSPNFIELAAGPADGAVLRGIAKPFLLYVGAFDWRKNVAAVVEAFALLDPLLRRRLQFVLAGESHLHSLEKIRAAWARAGLDGQALRILGHVTDAMLVQLYKQADLVIQPSLMEGFGLTALEAMYCGAPVIAADAGALPEIVGDARVLFDPKKPAAIAARIGEMLSDPARTGALIEAGRLRARQFSWPRTAALAVEALKSIARSGPGAWTPQTLRRVTAAHLPPLGRDGDFAAEILAAAEPRPPAPGRLLVDVTFTTREDHGTGIQRVVKNIATGLMARTGTPRTLFWCETREGLFEARIDSAGRLERTQALPAHRLRPGPDDHIVMLDSSWIYPDVYRQVMQRARLQGCDISTVLYDLVPLKMPAFCEPAMPGAFAYWLKSALDYSTGFVCISRAVADELLALLEAIRFPRPMRVGFWHMGADMRHGGAGSARGVPSDPPEFLMVSTLEPRKGYPVALQAFSRLWAEGFPGHLVIVGKRGWEMAYFEQVLKSHPEWNRKLHWLEGIDDAALQARYAACTALINTSYGEGFGMPVLEAAFHGKPAIVSDLPVFREIAKGVADVRYITPGSAEALAEAVRAFGARVPPETVPAMPRNWAQSAAELEQVVLGGHWYRTYQPRPFVERDDKASNKQLCYSLDWIEGPVPSGSKGAAKVIVRLTNLGDRVWSGEQGVTLGYRLLGPGGAVLPHRASRTPIPWIQSPGDAHYMSVVLDRRGLRLRPHAMEIALFNGEQGLWDSVLRVAL